jgi:hypothetical protein
MNMQGFKEYREMREKTLSEASGNKKPDENLWKRWKELVNMTAKELKEFYDSPDGKDAGMKQNEADRVGIDSGRESARMLMKMIPAGTTYKEAETNWTPDMWRWCGKQVSFNSRMRGMRKRMVGNPFERDGKMTRWLKSLLIWGHDPRKPVKKL